MTPPCYHCGLPCSDTDLVVGEKHFCCLGCQTVYEILNENDLCQYYDLNERPGITPGERVTSDRFAYLDDEQVLGRLLDFNEGGTARVTLHVPTMHCSSCIWLLENLPRLEPGVREARVNFMRKEVAVRYDAGETRLRKVVERMAAIGYEPAISLEDLENRERGRGNRSLYLKIGVAGFAFGNIMLLSFPEYLDVGGSLTDGFRRFFGYVNILLALPVLFYSASDYLVSAWKSLRHRAINIDVPLSLGILSFFGRSVFDIVAGHGAGYMDSFAGLIFLLLVGKLFQQKTYDTLSFERDYKSFFPIAVTRKGRDGEEQIPLARLEVGNRLLIRHRELIPADAVLIAGNATIDYSFVTGEAEPLRKRSGDTLYAGGRQLGAAIEVEVVKAVSQSYLTQLWNNDVFQKGRESRIETFTTMVSKYFTLGIISIATAAALFWLPVSLHLAANAFTAVLIIACPCALALSTPFTLGSIQRILGRFGFYLKNTGVIEHMARISAIVFDKTGTLTRSRSVSVDFLGVDDQPLSDCERRLVKSLVRHSTHPLSFSVYHHLDGAELAEATDFREDVGMGVSGLVEGRSVRVGSRQFAGAPGGADEGGGASRVYLAIEGRYRGQFRIAHDYREGLSAIFAHLAPRYDLALLSGDNDRERPRLERLFGTGGDMRFQQSPQDKLDYVEALQRDGHTVLMVGDGLNDAGALRRSDVGISVAEDLNAFAPACDAILEAGQFAKLSRFLRFARTGMRIIYVNFGISLMYNVVGLGFAVTGMLSPLICAVLMPLSSITVITIATGAAHLTARRLRLGEGHRSLSERPGRLMAIPGQKRAAAVLEEGA